MTKNHYQHIYHGSVVRIRSKLEKENCHFLDRLCIQIQEYLDPILYATINHSDMLILLSSMIKITGPPAFAVCSIGIWQRAIRLSKLLGYQPIVLHFVTTKCH
jgi:hypothetical protein